MSDQPVIRSQSFPIPPEIQSLIDANLRAGRDAAVIRDRDSSVYILVVAALLFFLLGATFALVFIAS